jgi:hypothetical protein
MICPKYIFLLRWGKIIHGEKEEWLLSQNDTTLLDRLGSVALALLIVAVFYFLSAGMAAIKP